MSETHGNSSSAHGPPPPAEPKTPMWLPALGAVLFLTAGLVWGLWPAEKPTGSAPPSASNAPAAAADAGAPAPKR